MSMAACGKEIIAFSSSSMTYPWAKAYSRKRSANAEGREKV